MWFFHITEAYMDDLAEKHNDEMAILNIMRLPEIQSDHQDEEYSLNWSTSTSRQAEFRRTLR